MLCLIPVWKGWGDVVGQVENQTPHLAHHDLVVGDMSTKISILILEWPILWYWVPFFENQKFWCLVITWCFLFQTRPKFTMDPCFSRKHLWLGRAWASPTQAGSHRELCECHVPEILRWQHGKPHTGRCTSVGSARKFTVPKQKAPHVKKHVVNMASNVASNSREERFEGRRELER